MISTFLDGAWDKQLAVEYFGSRLGKVSDSANGEEARTFDTNAPFLMSSLETPSGTHQFSSEPLGRYTALNGVPVEYDQHGRLTKVTDDLGTREFIYEGDNPKPIKILDGAANVLMELGYDLFNKLYRVRSTGNDWRYLLSVGDRTIGDYDPVSGELLTANYYFPKQGAPELLAQISRVPGRKTEFLAQAGAFSPIAKFDENGKRLATYELHPVTGALTARDSRGNLIPGGDRISLHGQEFLPHGRIADTLLRTLVYVQLGDQLIPLQWASSDPLSQSNPGHPYSAATDSLSLVDILGGQEERRVFSGHSDGTKACSFCHNKESDSDLLVGLSKEVVFEGTELVAAVREMQRNPNFALLYTADGIPLNPFWAGTMYGAKTCMVCHAYSCFPFYRDMFPTLTAWGDFGVMIGVTAATGGAGAGGVGAVAATTAGGAGGTFITYCREGADAAIEGAAMEAVFSAVTWGLGKILAKAVETARRASASARAANTGGKNILEEETKELASETGKKCGKKCTGDDLEREFQKMFEQEDLQDDYVKGVVDRFNDMMQEPGELPLDTITSAIDELGEGFNINLSTMHRGLGGKGSGLKVEAGIDELGKYADVTNKQGLTFQFIRDADHCDKLSVTIFKRAADGERIDLSFNEQLTLILRDKFGNSIEAEMFGGIATFQHLDETMNYTLDVRGF